MSLDTPVFDEGGVEVKSNVHSNSVRSISLSSCGYLAVTASADQHVVVWLARERVVGKEWKDVKKKRLSSSVGGCSFHPHLFGGMLFATACNGGEIKLHRIKKRQAQVEESVTLEEQLVEEKSGESAVSSLIFSPCGSRMVVGFGDGTLRVYKVEETTAESRREEEREARVEEGAAGVLTPDPSRQRWGTGTSVSTTHEEERDDQRGMQRPVWPKITRVAELESAHYGGYYGSPALSSFFASKLEMATIGAHDRCKVNVWGCSKDKGQRKDEWSQTNFLHALTPVNRIAFASSSLPYYRHLKQVVDSEEFKQATRHSAGKSDLGGLETDLLAVGCNGGVVTLWSVDTSKFPPRFSEPTHLIGVHTSHVYAVAFSISLRDHRTLLITGDDEGGVHVWKGFAPSLSSSSLHSLQAPSFQHMQRISSNEGGIYNCSVSPRMGCSLGAVQSLLGRVEGCVSFWPRTGLGGVGGGDFEKLGQMGLLEECLSTCELDRIGMEFFSMQFPYSELDTPDPSLRPISAHLWSALKANQEGIADSTPKEEEGMASTADEKSAINNMLKASLGFFSSSLEVQKQVEVSLSAVIPALPALLKKCRQNQTVLGCVYRAQDEVRAIQKAEKEKDDEEVERKRGSVGYMSKKREVEREKEKEKSRLRLAGLRADMMNEISGDHLSIVSTQILSSMRNQLQKSIEKLKAELDEVEQKEIARSKASADDEERSARNYLLTLQNISMQKTKAAVPFLLHMSDQIEVDLLALDGSALAGVFGMKDLEDVKKSADSILRFVKQQRENIQEWHQHRLGNITSLSTFLAGQVPTESHFRLDDVALASTWSRLPPCHFSRWQREFADNWAWLEQTVEEWREVEKRIERIDVKEPGEKELLSLLSAIKSSYFEPSSDQDRAINRVKVRCDEDATCLRCEQRDTKIRVRPCKHRCICTECVNEYVHDDRAADQLSRTAFYALPAVHPPLMCPLCGERVRSLSHGNDS